jgi:phosphate/sulfate permease
MREILGLGVTVGLLTAIWSLHSSGSILLALLAYSVAGTVTAFVVAIFIAMLPEEEPDEEAELLLE